ncbi:MAG: hypothetical protein IJ327_03170 [Lachnospiraceae bacterium]|nr:hypothetical protein [Lachnospiraceae bacterium]
MAKNDKIKDQASENKVVTKYDRKVQRRAEEEKKAKREQLRNTVLGVLAVVVVFAFFISFPIRNWMALNGTYVEIAGEGVNKVEFDYQFNMIKNNYFTQNSYMLSYFGMDTEGDLSTQMYSEDLSWKDFFEKMTVQTIAQNKLLIKEANEKGFEYDVTEDYNEYLQMIKDSAVAQEITEEEYMIAAFGEYATIDRLESAIKEALYANAYYQQVGEDVYPAEADVNAYYEEHKNNYDSVDYRIVKIEADLPTEPTELADPVDETKATDESATADGTTEEPAYTPSEAEVAKAMADAKAKAEEALKTISTEGILSENVLRNSAVSVLRSWLFDEERKAGETTIIEDEEMHTYYVLEFLKRYRDETPSADLRLIITDQGNGQAILDEWKAGEATEESFIKLVETYSIDTATEEGFYEGVLPLSVADDLDTWVSSNNTKGDTVVIDIDDTTQYVMYYIGENKPNWQLTIESSLLADNVEEYLTNLIADVEIKDKGNLNYIKVEASVAAEAEVSEEGTVEATPAE